MKKILLILAIFLVACQTQIEETETIEIPEQTAVEIPEEIIIESPEVSEETEELKTFKITGQDFKFTINGQDNPDIIVNSGDTVRIEFTSTQGFHSWAIDEFNAATQQVSPSNGATTIEFTADKTGTYEYYCNVGNHRLMGMKGKLIVQ